MNMNHFNIRFDQILSLGSIRLKSGFEGIHETTFWWEITFLFIEITFGYINTKENE